MHYRTAIVKMGYYVIQMNERPSAFSRRAMVGLNAAFVCKTSYKMNCLLSLNSALLERFGFGNNKNFTSKMTSYVMRHSM